MEKISRREFIKRGIVLGAGLLALPFLGRSRAAGPLRPVRARFGKKLAG